MRRNHLFALGGSLMMALGGVASADAAEQTEVQSELQSLKARIAEIESQNWMTERRAEEVKSLVREVLSDADTRASLMQEGITAGHDGKSFFLASPDGSFRLNVAGQLQFRWVSNFEDDTDNGFAVRRAKVKFNGHVADPRLSYTFVLANTVAGNTFLEDAYFGYELSDALQLQAGRFKAPFLREELTSSTRLLAVERASVTEHFTLNRSEGVQLSWLGENMRGSVMVNDGTNQAGTQFNNDLTEFAISARGDLKLAGDWDAMKDTSDWSAHENAAFVGAGVHYQTPDDAGDALGEEYLAWTIDGSLEHNGLGLYAAYMGADADAGNVAREVDDLGLLVQAGYFIVPDKFEPFARWEYVDVDVAGGTESNLFTVGANYYFDAHNAKFTADVVFADNGIVANPYAPSAYSNNLGLVGAPDDEIALRAQFQLLF